MLSLQTALEEGRFRGRFARTCAATWARISERTVVRPLKFPHGARVIAVGGATLGGSGKTPLAIACAKELAAAGARVALVGHAYRARPGRARVVLPGDALREVGDEALVAARALIRAGVRVIVAPRRSDAVALAAREADILILDGVAQTSPVPAALALLAVDAVEPWGHADSIAPCGDLRAPRAALLHACDGVVAVSDAAGRVGIDAGTRAELLCNVLEHDLVPLFYGRVPAWHAWTASTGARVGDTVLPWDDLCRVRVGLLCAMARPERVVRSLERRGVSPRLIVRVRDHGPLDAGVLARAAREAAPVAIDLWLATPKCVLHFAKSALDVGNILQSPMGVIDSTLVLSRGLRHRLRSLAVP